MSRYLTPGKIGILALTFVYLDARVSNASTIPVLSFALDTIKHRTPTWRELEDGPLVFSVRDFQFLEKHASSIPGRSVWDVFLQQLWSISNFDALHVFMDSTSEWLERTRTELLEDINHEEQQQTRKLSRNAPLGVFVRRAHLEFSRLQLHDGMRLWKDFVAFREPTFAAWKKRHPGEDKTVDLMKSAKLNGLLYRDMEDEAHLTSVTDRERLLKTQVTLMQQSGLRVPREVRDRMREMLISPAAGVTSSYVHYSAFLDAWRAGDYHSAFDELHRYFDYTMQQSGRKFYHVALLNMAFLHADFGCYADALAAIKESISMAREHKDVACLNFSLSWLYNFSKQHFEEMGDIPDTGVLGGDREALTFIKSKARDTQSWSLLCTSLLAEAELTLVNGESVATAFETLAKVAFLNHRHRLQFPVGAQMMLETALYARLGINQLEHSASDLYQELYSESSLASGRLAFTTRIAARLARGGRYERAIEHLQSVDAELLRLPQMQKQWTMALLLLKLQRALYQSDYLAVQHHLAQARALESSADAVDLQIHLCAIDYEMRREQYSEALTLIESLLSSPRIKRGDVHDRLLLMVLKARAFDRAGVPQKGFSIAIRAASAALKGRILDVLFPAVLAVARILLSLREYEASGELLSSIMPAVLESEDREIGGLCYMALADAQMGCAGRVMRREAMDPGTVVDERAQKQKTDSAKRLSGDSARRAEGLESVRKKEHLTLASAYLERAFTEYAQIGDVKGQSEAMAKRAVIMRVNGDDVLANDFAAKLLEVRRLAIQDRAGAENKGSE